MQYIKDTAKLTTLPSPCVIKHELFTQVKDFSSYAIDQEQLQIGVWWIVTGFKTEQDWLHIYKVRKQAKKLASYTWVDKSNLQVYTYIWLGI